MRFTKLVFYLQTAISFPDEFLCVGSCACIPLAFRCDGDADCTGHQDELECGEDKLDRDQPCLEYENNIRCPRSGKCINKAWLCDGDDDCGDFSDETHCDGKPASPEEPYAEAAKRNGKAAHAGCSRLNGKVIVIDFIWWCRRSK